MFKIAILFCDLDRLLWTLSIPTDAFISNVSIATPDSFSLVLLPGKSSSILLPSICVRLHALGVSRYIGFLKIESLGAGQVTHWLRVGLEVRALSCRALARIPPEGQ